MAVIEVAGLHKRYGDVVAVEDVSFSVEEGEIFPLAEACLDRDQFAVLSAAMVARRTIKRQ